MKCTHTKRLLPLYIGGDLPIQQADSVRAHLFACQHCNDLADGHSESAGWLISEGRLDFDERFFEELRDSVWRSVAAEQKASSVSSRRYSWLLLFASAAAIALLAAVPLLHNRKGAPAMARVEVDKDAEPGRTSVAVAGISNASQHAKRSGSRRAVRHSEVTTALQAIRSEPRESVESPQARDEGAASSTNTVRRIEIQTADPNIRIIWLVRVPTQVGADD
jgi:hypothetical protein